MTIEVGDTVVVAPAINADFLKGDTTVIATPQSTDAGPQTIEVPDLGDFDDVDIIGKDFLAHAFFQEAGIAGDGGAVDRIGKMIDQAARYARIIDHRYCPRGHFLWFEWLRWKSHRPVQAR